MSPDQVGENLLRAFPVDLVTTPHLKRHGFSGDGMSQQPLPLPPDGSVRAVRFLMQRHDLDRQHARIAWVPALRESLWDTLTTDTPLTCSVWVDLHQHTSSLESVSE
jgi:hypothetical protein